jgi:hypothetical protein
MKEGKRGGDLAGKELTLARGKGLASAHGSSGSSQKHAKREWGRGIKRGGSLKSLVQRGNSWRHCTGPALLRPSPQAQVLAIEAEQRLWDRGELILGFRGFQPSAHSLCGSCCSWE